MQRSLTPDASLQPRLGHAFAPVNKRALGLAVGVTLGGAIAMVTLFHVIVQPPNAPNIGLLAHYFYGYTVSWPGSLVGFFWGFVLGFVFAWFLGFLRNLLLATWLLVIKTRAALSQPFLDHI